MADSTASADAPTATGRSSGPRAGGLILTIVLTLVVVAGIGAFFWSETYKSPSGTDVAQSAGYVTIHGQRLQHVKLSFQTYPDSTGSVNGVAIHPSGNPSWPAYGPSNIFQVPAHALVTVTVRQYDSGGALNNSWFGTVRGTVGNVASFQIGNGPTRKLHQWNANDVGHTFTVRGTPGTDPKFFLNVPLPAVGGNNQTDNGQHNTIVFSFISGSKGTYAWNCEFPCGQMVASFGGVMGAYGFMSGFIHVV